MSPTREQLIEAEQTFFSQNRDRRRNRGLLVKIAQEIYAINTVQRGIRYEQIFNNPEELEILSDLFGLLIQIPYHTGTEADYQKAISVHPVCFDSALQCPVAMWSNRKVFDTAIELTPYSHKDKKGYAVKWPHLNMSYEIRSPIIMSQGFPMSNVGEMEKRIAGFPLDIFIARNDLQTFLTLDHAVSTNFQAQRHLLDIIKIGMQNTVKPLLAEAE